MTLVCDKCFKQCDDSHLSIYGILMCEDCWDDYLFTDYGMVEYLVGLVRGIYRLEDFDAEFLSLALTQWEANKNQFDIQPQEVLNIENYLKKFNLF